MKSFEKLNLLWFLLWSPGRTDAPSKAPKKAKMNIPQPHFLLRDPKDKKSTLINCHLRFNNERIVFSTGEKIVPVEWDKKKQRAINSKKFPHNSELNVWLDKIEAEIKSVFRAFNLDGVSPTIDVIKDKINERLFNKVNDKMQALDSNSVQAPRN